MLLTGRYYITVLRAIAKNCLLARGAGATVSHGSTLTPDQLAADDALIKSAQAGVGETEIAVLPEIEALIHQNLVPEPTGYPPF